MSRLRAWTLESRTRYALVWGGINAAAVFSIILVIRSSYISVGRALSYMALAFVVNVLGQALIWYPRAKRRLTTHPRMS